MPNNPAGTIERIGLELGSALEPLKELLGPEFFNRLGVTLPFSLTANNDIVNKFTAAGNVAKNFQGQIDALNAAITAQDTTQIISASVELVGNIAQFVARMVEVGTAINNAAASLPAVDKAAVQQLAADISTRTLEYVVVGYLKNKLPGLTSILNLLAILDIEHVPADSLDVSQVPVTPIPRRFHIERIPELLKDPVKYLNEIYKWGDAVLPFEGKPLLNKILQLVESIGIPAVIYDEPGSPPTLESYFFSLSAVPSPPSLNFTFSLPGSIDFERTINFSDVWKGRSKAVAAFNAGIEVIARPPFSIEVKPPTGDVQLTALLSLIGEKPGTESIDILSFAGGSRLQVKKIESSVGVRADFGTSGGKVVPMISADLTGGKLLIDFSQGDGFIQKILSNIRLDADFSVGADWDPEKGLRFRGDAGVEILMPLHIDLSVIIVDGLYFKIGMSDQVPLQIGLATKFTASLGPLKAVVEKIGLNVNITFPPEGNGNVGMANVAFGFKPPNGVGLSLDTGVVKGGGYLYFDFDKEEYAGVLELGIAKIVTVKAIALITTKMPDGSKGFSMLIIITAEFGTGIQLGFGFTLLGVGGLLGVNRTMLPESIAQGIRTGGLNSVMFPVNPVANAPKIISDLRTWFPPYEGRFLIGPMAKIGWGTPSLISISFGLIIEIPGNIAIIGVMRMALPTEEAATVVLNVGFIGALEFDKKRLWFFASIYDSRILFLTLEGDMGLLMDYGDSPSFILSVGGFHPLFTPPPLPFPDPRRIRIDILRNALQRISVECYFAVTSNTVQFGARADLYIGLAVVEVTGYFTFDALFQFSPFKFIIQLSFSVSLKVFGAGLFSIHLQLMLEGPTPWHAAGTGTLSIDLWLFEIEVSASFDITWGDSQNVIDPPIKVLLLLAEEFKKVENWLAKVLDSNNLLVSLRKVDDGSSPNLVLHPLGTLVISQRAVPLGLGITKVGSRKIEDGQRFNLEVTTTELQDTGNRPQEKFAVAQYQELSKDEKLTRPSFQDYEGGVALSVAGRQLGSSKAVRRVVRYETIIIDSNYKRFVIKFFAPIGTLFLHFLKGAAVSKSKLSKAYKKSLVPRGPDERVKVGSADYVVAGLANNKLVNDQAVFTSEGMARDYMNSYIKNNPGLEGEVHVIPKYEANLN
jgi:hypothetical protein